MDLKLFVFKIILIFNVVAVYSISCKQLASPNKYKIGEYYLTIRQVLGTGTYDNTGIIVWYKDSYLEDVHHSQGHRQIVTEICTTKGDGTSYLAFSAHELKRPIEITNL